MTFVQCWSVALVDYQTRCAEKAGRCKRFYYKSWWCKVLEMALSYCPIVVFTSLCLLFWTNILYRTPLMEIIVDELTYDNEILSPVLQVWLYKFFISWQLRFFLWFLNDNLQVLDHPRWKLELVLQYFTKYTARVRLRLRNFNFTGFCISHDTYESFLLCCSLLFVLGEWLSLRRMQHSMELWGHLQIFPVLKAS